jgi:hypothetical protein
MKKKSSSKSGDTRKGASVVIRKKNRTKQQGSVLIAAWENDPGSAANPDGGNQIQVEVPSLTATSLPVKIENPATAPKPQVYSQGTANFRYWTAVEALSRCSGLWSPLLPGVSWQVGKILPVDLDHGEDLNAFYDRVGLRFFHETVAGRKVFSGESPDVVCHEQGHAVLDSIKPELWDAAFLEAAAFHESFGDMSAILSALQLQSMRKNVLGQTGSHLYRSSDLSRLAEQLGWAIRQGHPSQVEPDCLRNAVNPFLYQSPDTIPSSGPASTLSSEPHSFSRVFTAAFYEGLANMLSSQTVNDEKGLLNVSKDIANILIQGIVQAAVIPSFYSQVAIKMLAVAEQSFANTGNEDALKSSFIRHGILLPADGAAVATQISSTKAFSLADAAGSPKELNKMKLQVPDLLPENDTITVFSATSPQALNITGAAADSNTLKQGSPEKAARFFIENLLQRGRLKVDSGRKKMKVFADAMRLNQGSFQDVHTHELVKENGDTVLRRIRIDCGY